MRLAPTRAGLLLAGLLAAAACPAQQHRVVDPVHTRAVPGAPGSVGGPRNGSSTSRPRFPLVPAGSPALHSTAAATRRPVTKTTAPAAMAARPPARTVARHGGAVANRPAIGHLNGKSSIPAPAKSARTSARTAAPAHGSGTTGPVRATHGGATAAAPEKGAPASDAGKNGNTGAPAADTPGAADATPSKTTAPQQ